jgi:hypothetical protein
MATVAPIPDPLESSAGVTTARDSGETSAWLSPEPPSRRGQRAERLTAVLRLGLAVLFVGAASTKLIGLPRMVALFDSVGLGQWFRYGVGAYELAGAAGLVWWRTAPWAAGALSVLMVGAGGTEVVILHRVPLSSGATLAVLLLVLWRSRR